MLNETERYRDTTDGLVGGCPFSAYCRTFCVLTSPFITNDYLFLIIGKLGKKFAQRSLNLTEKRNRRAKSPGNNSCRTRIRYGCHFMSCSVIRLKLEREIWMGLRRALAWGSCWSTYLTASIFSAVRMVLLPELPYWGLDSFSYSCGTFVRFPKLCMAQVDCDLETLLEKRFALRLYWVFLYNLTKIRRWNNVFFFRSQ